MALTVESKRTLGILASKHRGQRHRGLDNHLYHGAKHSFKAKPQFLIFYHFGHMDDFAFVNTILHLWSFCRSSISFWAVYLASLLTAQRTYTLHNVHFCWSQVWLLTLISPKLWTWLWFLLYYPLNIISSLMVLWKLYMVTSTASGTSFMDQKSSKWFFAYHYQT